MVGLRRSRQSAARRASMARTQEATEKTSIVNNTINQVEPIRQNIEEFSIHMSRYTGKTVTIFVIGGGKSGIGFTGVLLYANKIYVRLVVVPGPAPACSLGSPCSFYPTSWPYNNFICSYSASCLSSLGAIVDIPADKIASFVHNAV